MKKKLVKINHIRCDEWTGTTYLLALENITEEQLQQDAETAQNNYLQGIKDFKEAGLQPETFSIPHDLSGLSSDLTIGELRNQLEENRQKIKEWEDKRSISTRSFAYYMYQLGYFDLGDDEDALEAEVDWGHRHGQTLDISRTKTNWELY